MYIVHPGRKKHCKASHKISNIEQLLVIAALNAISEHEQILKQYQEAEHVHQKAELELQELMSKLHKTKVELHETTAQLHEKEGSEQRTGEQLKKLANMLAHTLEHKENPKI